MAVIITWCQVRFSGSRDKFMAAACLLNPLRKTAWVRSAVFFGGLMLFGLVVFSVEPVQAAGNSFSLTVPFTSQAPTGEWKDQRQQDGCEEAVVAMAMAWVGGEKNIKPADWRLRILILSTFEKKKYGEYRDIAVPDILAWLIKDYFNYQRAEIKPVESSAAILRELELGRVVLTPINGRVLKNPNFSGLGPERHMILIKGYDYRTKEFITNDPGTRNGENYRYSEKVIFNAIRPYLTGYHKPFGKLVKQMIVVSPNLGKK